MDTAPAYPEEVTAGDPASPVAIVTLWTRQERILRGVPRELYAACGNLYSVWGIGLLVQSIVARPTIRYLVVCGVDFADSGRALVALCEQGLTADGTIVGTDTRLAVDATTVDRFRRQVTLVDLRGCTRAAEVAAVIRALPGVTPAAGAAGLSGPTGPRSSGAVGIAEDVGRGASAAAHVAAAGAPAADAAPSSATPAEGPRRDDSQRAADAGSAGPSIVIPASRSRTALQPDPRGNFLIAVAAGEIVAAHATTTGGPTGQRFSGGTAAEVYGAILGADLVSRLDHAAYLGAELARAEIALRADVPYRQDSALRLPGRP
jgi:hypothetical protein